ncbi:DUF2897 family protein [uncultured Shewanella sp.]|uniref:DUF2897 family protein n=1 Tax=uncultured Shewanella sp. TaxID=173975 RepID=UPI00262098C1|nr:DUF2897 family protein [uncultured Shewanella sp.]
MSTLETWLIIILIVGIIASNLVVLKYSAKFKLTQFGKVHKKLNKHSQEKPNVNNKSPNETPNRSETSSDDTTQHKKQNPPNPKS